MISPSDNLSEKGEHSWEFVNKPSSEGNRKNSQQKIFTFKSDQEKKWIEKYYKEKFKSDLNQETPWSVPYVLDRSLGDSIFSCFFNLTSNS